MLSKLFKSARKSVTLANTSTDDTFDKLHTSAPMVTTRQSAKVVAEEALSGNGDTIVVQTPLNNSRKRQGPAKKSETPSLVKQEASPVKKQKLPIRTEDDDVPTQIHTHLAVEIPVSQVAPSSAARSTRPRRIGLDAYAKLEPDTEVLDSDFEEELESPQKFYTPASTMKGLARFNKDFNGSADPESSALKPKHKRFGSAEPETKVLLPSMQEELIERDLEEDSDDDAPEEVVAQDAEEDAKKSLRDAAKALEEQESAIRKKRKDRDAFLKQQAESASKKRKRVEVIDKRPENLTEESLNKSIGAEDESLVGESGGESDADGNASNGSAGSLALNEREAPGNASPRNEPVDATDIPVDDVPTKASNVYQANLPDLLPAEYLADDDLPDMEMSEQLEPLKKTKKIKFSNFEDKKPKDLRKGATTFRVVGSQNTLLAPKASFQARSTKESWLAGRPGKGGQTNRKPVSSDFFVSKK